MSSLGASGWQNCLLFKCSDLSLIPESLEGETLLQPCKHPPPPAPPIGDGQGRCRKSSCTSTLNTPPSSSLSPFLVRVIAV